MSFTFTCTFLEPTGEIKIGDTSKTYDYVTEDSSYTFTVPVADLTEEDGTVVPSFTIPVQWRTGAYTAGELQEEISLEVAFAQLPAGYTGTVATTGVITGAIDYKQIASTRAIAEMLVGGFADWKEEFGNDPLGLIRAEAQVDYAMNHITLPANTVYAKIPADTGYTVVHEYYTSTNGGAFELTGTVRTQAEGEEGDQILPEAVQVPVYEENEYTYVSSDPENGLVLSADLEKNVITLRYERTVTTGGGGSSRDYYDVTVNYYDQDGNTIRSSYTTGDIREGRSWDVTDRQLDTITYNGATYTFDRAEGDPLSGTNIREDKVIDLYYTAESENIPDPEVPEGELPTDPTDPGTTDPTDPTDPTQPGGGTDLEDPDVPTAEVPETGDASLIWAAAALLSGIGLAWLVISGKKREENA